MRKVFRYISLAAFALAAMTFVSCDKDDTTTVPSEDTVYFPIGDKIQIHPLGDELHVSFTSDVDWKVEVEDSGTSWLKIEKDSKSLINNKLNKGTVAFDISADVNYGEKDTDNKTAVIKFKDNVNNTLHSVTVSQNAAYIILDKAEDLYEWYRGADRGDERIYKIRSNIHWECTFTADSIFHVSSNEGGRLNQEDIKELTIYANDINLDDEIRETSLMFTALKKDAEGNVIDRIKDVESLKLTQDNLIFNAPEEFSNTIGELGAYSSSSGEANTAQIEVQTETDYRIRWRMENESEDNFRDYNSENVWFSIDTRRSGENVYAYQMTAKVESANPDTLARIAIIRLESTKNPRAYRDVKLTQNPYTWNVTVGKLLAQDNSTTTLVIDTKGPWTVNIPEAADWWQSSVTEWQGEGYKEIVIKSTKWNLDLENDWPALLEVSNSLNALRSNMTLIKEHYHFNIGENLVKDSKTARAMLAELLKQNTNKYEVEVDCSGDWMAEYSLPDWVNISDLGNETPMSGNATFSLGAMTKNPKESDREAKIIFTSLTHKNENETVTDTLYMKQLKHVFGWEPDEWTDETRNQYCNQPAYIAGDDTHTFGFETTFSDVWSLKSDQPWVKFHMGKNSDDKSSKISGTGAADTEDYVYVTVDHNFNTGFSDRTATVTVRDEFKGTEKSFTISQDPFVFDVTGSPITTVGPLDVKTVTYNIKITKGAPWILKLTDPKQLIASGYTKDGKGTGDAEAVTLTTCKVTDVNTDDRSATVEVRVKDDKCPLVETFTVNQNEYNFNCDDDKLSSFHEVNFSTQTVVVDCYNDDWELKSVSENWLNATKEGNVIKLTPKDVNKKTDSENEAKIEITTPFGGEPKTLSFEVKQDKYKFAVTDKPTSLDFEPLDVTTKKTVKIEASAGWSSGLSGEAKLGNTEDKNAKTISVKPTEANYDTRVKEGKLTITSDHGHKEEVTFTQKAYKFSPGNMADKTVGSDAVTIEFTELECTGKLAVKDVVADGSWLKITDVEIVDNKTIKVKVPANDAKDAKTRDAKITISSEHVNKNSNLTKTITITQDPKTTN